MCDERLRSIDPWVIEITAHPVDPETTLFHSTNFCNQLSSRLFALLFHELELEFLRIAVRPGPDRQHAIVAAVIDYARNPNATPVLEAVAKFFADLELPMTLSEPTLPRPTWL